MKFETQRLSTALITLGFAVFVLCLVVMTPKFDRKALAQDSVAKIEPSATPEFDQEAALARLRERIKGKEKEPAEKVFRNIIDFKGVPAGRLLAIMQFGYARSLGVDCTHCHTPGKWASESKPTKQIARDMKAMAAKLNRDINNMESLGGRKAIINCTTCHRGQVKPALNLPRPKPKSDS